MENQVENSKSPESTPLNLKDVLVEPKSDYREIIDRVNNQRTDVEWEEDLQTNFADNIYRELAQEQEKADEQLKQQLLEGVEGQVLLDLGGGGISSEMIAEKLKAKALVCVNKHLFSSSEEEDPSEDLTHGSKSGDTQVITIKADMLDLLSRMPDNSVSVMVNGIDTEIINDEEYILALAKEIVRTLSSKGVVFGVNSTVLDRFELILHDGSSNIDGAKKVIRDSLVIRHIGRSGIIKVFGKSSP